MKSPVTGSINLASAPFRRERAEIATFATICGVLLCSLLVLVGLIFHARGQAASLRRQIAVEEARLRRIQSQQTGFAAVLNRPENAGIFSTSVFLNELIARRGVSWTHVFKDLETVMPSNMRLLAIRLPQVGPSDDNGANRVQLDMILGTAEPRALIMLLKNLQQSPIFGAASLASQSPPTQNDALYKYRVTVAYDQKL